MQSNDKEQADKSSQHVEFAVSPIHDTQNAIYQCQPEADQRIGATQDQSVNELLNNLLPMPSLSGLATTSDSEAVCRRIPVEAPAGNTGGIGMRGSCRRVAFQFSFARP